MSLQPSHHCLALKNTSLWLFLPAYYHFIEGENCLSLLCFALSIASWLHWSKFSLTGWRRKLDILLASTYVISQALHKQSKSPADLVLRTASLLFFIRACIFIVGQEEGLVAHLMFRYLAWIAVMKNFVSYEILLGLSPMYVITGAYSISPIFVADTIGAIAMGRTHESLKELTQDP
jgi:hypothetical protein